MSEELKEIQYAFPADHESEEEAHLKAVVSSYFNYEVILLLD